MFMCKYVSIYVFVYMCVYMFVTKYVYVYVRMYNYYKWKRGCMNVYLYVCMHKVCFLILIYVYM